MPNFTQSQADLSVLDVPISALSREKILARISIFLRDAQFHRITTVNPEFLVMADNDPVFKQSLLSADLCVADGIGIVLAGLLQGKRIVRFPGVDLMHEILTIAERDGHTVYLAIKKDGLSSYEEIRTALLQKHPRLLIDGRDVSVQEPWESYQLKARSYQLLFCNFGAPAQELFLEGLRAHPGDVRLAMGVGGSFDFMTGKKKRAPQWLRAIGLEWLWRLILQPSRFRRIWNALAIFPVKVLIR